MYHDEPLRDIALTNIKIKTTIKIQKQPSLFCGYGLRPTQIFRDLRGTKTIKCKQILRRINWSEHDEVMIIINIKHRIQSRVLTATQYMRRTKRIIF